MKDQNITLDNLPIIEGLRFRQFNGESDYPAMVSIIEAASKADQEDRAVTLDDIKHDYNHLTHSDPHKDMLFAEIDGEAIAYSRVEWYQEEAPNDRVYSQFVNIHPRWRHQGIEFAMIGWCEDRLRTIAEGHPQDSNRYFQTYSSEFKPAFNTLLESLGYKAARFFIEMSRSLDKIPPAELPPGITVQPVGEEDVRQVWDASIEAFRDHWGFSEPEEKDFVGYKGSKFFQPNSGRSPGMVRKSSAV